MNILLNDRLQNNIRERFFSPYLTFYRWISRQRRFSKTNCIVSGYYEECSNESLESSYIWKQWYKRKIYYGPILIAYSPAWGCILPQLENKHSIDRRGILLTCFHSNVIAHWPQNLSNLFRNFVLTITKYLPTWLMSYIFLISITNSLVFTKMFIPKNL